MQIFRRRWLWILLAGLVGAAVVAALVLPGLIDVERHRARIERAVGDATGCRVSLGSIDLDVWPALAVRVSPVGLTPPAGASKVDVASVEARAALWPLLGGRLEVREVRLVEPSILLVRTPEGFGLPLPTGRGGAGAAGGATESGGDSASFSIARVEIVDGTLRIDDRTAVPPWSLVLEELDLDVVPASGTVQGTGRLIDDGGRIEIAGSVVRGLALKLLGVKTDVLQPWLGAGLVRPGGAISGDVNLKLLPLRVAARLVGEDLHVLAGEAPLGRAEVDLDLAPADGAWLVEKLDLRAAGAEIHGKGRVAPDVLLDFELPPTPLAPVLELVRALFPLPLDLAGPGSAQAVLHLEQPAGGVLIYESRGTLSASRFRAAETLPEATDLRASFELSRSGALTVRIEEGKVAGGPLHGVARMDRVSPPGKLVLDGDLTQAALGQLLSGFVERAPERIVGLTAADATLVVDLGRASFDLRSLGGRMKLRSDEVQLPGFDLEGALRAAVADKLSVLGDLTKGARSQAPAGAATAAVKQVIEHLEAEVDFDAWPWRLIGLALHAGGVEASGEGTFDPAAGEIDLRLAVAAGPELTAELTGRYPGLSRLTGPRGTLTVPARIRGTLTAPRIGVDAGDLARQSIKGARPQDAVRGLVEGLLQKKKKGQK